MLRVHLCRGLLWRVGLTGDVGALSRCDLHRHNGEEAVTGEERVDTGHKTQDKETAYIPPLFSSLPSLHRGFQDPASEPFHNLKIDEQYAKRQPVQRHAPAIK